LAVNIAATRAIWTCQDDQDAADPVEITSDIAWKTAVQYTGGTALISVALVRPI